MTATEHRAQARFKHQAGFRLDSDQLRRLYRLMRSRSAVQGGASEPILKVYRSDHTTYTTNDLEVLSSEDNSPARRIEEVGLASAADVSPAVEMTFSRESGITLRVEGVERDSVVALFDDLRSFISKEIARPRIVARTITNPWTFVLIPWVMFIASPILSNIAPTPGNRAMARYDKENDAFKTTLEKWKSTSAEIRLRNEERKSKETGLLRPQAEQATISSKPEDKLQFLVSYFRETLRVEAETEKVPDYPNYPEFPRRSFVRDRLYLGGFYAMLFAVLAVVGLAVGALSDPYIFLLGREVDAQRRRAELRERLVWGVLVSFVLGVLASIVAALVVARVWSFR